jgi:ABC-type transport system substrate-binding protein
MSMFKSDDRSKPQASGGPLLGRAGALLIVFVVTAMALAGCGGSSQTTSSQDAAAAQSAAVPSAIRIADDQVVTTLDPVPIPDYEFDQLTFLWGGFLTTYGPGQPFLAKTVSASDDFKVWTVTLRAGLKFSNGAPITVRDVVASLERVAKTKGIAVDQFVGAFFSNLSSLTAEGGSTVVFRFRAPNPDFAKQVSVPEMVIVPATGIAEGASFWKHPVSAGRYRIDSADLVNGNFSFSANPSYSGAPPEVKRIVVTSVPDAATRLAQLKSGQIDYAENLPGDLLPQVTGNLRVDPAPWFGGSLLLQPNLAKGSILSDVRIRQAINLAIDRNQIAETALGGQIAGRPLYGIPWNQTNAAPNVAAFPPDLAKAGALLKGTACQNGCTVPTTYYTDAVWQLPVTIQVVAQQLSKIGIKLALQGIPISQGSPYTTGWELNMGWTGDYDNSTICTSNYYVTSQWETPTGFSSTAMTALGERMAIANPSQLPAMTQQANTLFAQYLPIIPLTTLTYLAGSSLPASVLTNTGAAYFEIR